MDCHIEIWLDDCWRECAVTTFSDFVQRGMRATGTAFEYNLTYAFTDGSEAASLAFPLSADRIILDDWPPFLYDLVPQGNGRKFLLGRMMLADAPAADLPLLMAGAFNPIGRLRIREAVEYYNAHVDQHDLATRGFELGELISRDATFHEHMMVHGMLAAGGTGIQGVAPKYLFTQATDGLWYPDASLPDTHSARHFIVKRPRGQTDADKKVLRNERGYMAVAKAMGLRVHAPLEQYGDLLFIPRFDRRKVGTRVERLHQESLASISGLTGFGNQADQFVLLTALRAVVADPTQETIEFLKRDVLNLALRNTDNHARNTAVQTCDGMTRLSPLFDFAPMYLDPEGIARSSRWYDPVSRKELTSWRAVFAGLALGSAERHQIVQEMRAFGELLSNLEEAMRTAEIDADIVDFVRPSIMTQQAQLLELG